MNKGEVGRKRIYPKRTEKKIGVLTHISIIQKIYGNDQVKVTSIRKFFDIMQFLDSKYRPGSVNNSLQR